MNGKIKKITYPALLIFSCVGLAVFCAVLSPQAQHLIIQFMEDHIRRRPLEPEKLAKWAPLISSYAKTGVFFILFVDICIFALPSRFCAFLIRKINERPLLFLAACAVLLEFVFFRQIIFNPDLLIGSNGDARLINLILEHWYTVFTFQAESVLQVPFFAPLPHTLGFSDTFFIYAIPYTLFRLAGFDWLGAQQLLWMLVHFCGGLGLVILLRKYFKLPVYAVLAGLIIGNYSNAYYIATVHPQLFSLSLLPFASIFIVKWYRGFSNTAKRMRYGCGLIVFFALLAFSTFYMAFFFALFLGIAHLVLFCRNIKHIQFGALPGLISAHLKELLLYLSVCVLSLLPFLVTYLPALFNREGVSLGPILASPQYFALFNVSPGNILWGFPPIDSSFGSEAVTGFPFLTLVLGILGIAESVSMKDKKTLVNRVLFCSAVSVCIMELLILRFNNNFTFWIFVNRLIPGASVIQSAARINLFISFPLGLIVAFYLSGKIGSLSSKKIKYFAAFALTVFIFLEHQNSGSIANWKKSDYRAYIAGTAAPPEKCEYFALLDKRIVRSADDDSNDRFKDANIDALMIALFYRVKAVNGYSGFEPDGWKQPFDGEAGTAWLKDWVKKYNLRNVYIYEASENSWFPFEG